MSDIVHTGPRITYGGAHRAYRVDVHRVLRQGDPAPRIAESVTVELWPMIEEGATRSTLPPVEKDPDRIVGVAVRITKEATADMMADGDDEGGDVLFTGTVDNYTMIAADAVTRARITLIGGELESHRNPRLGTTPPPHVPLPEPDEVAEYRSLPPEETEAWVKAWKAKRDAALP